MVFRATSAGEDTKFETFMPREQLVAGERVVKFYVGESYPKVNGYPGYPAFGKADASQFAPAYRNGVFSASIKSQGEGE